MSSILRNFGLTADEIRVMEAIRELTNALENIQFFTDSQPSKAESKAELFFAEIEKLEDTLERIRENTQIILPR